MQGGGLVFVFALPIWAAAFICGALVSSKISAWILFFAVLIIFSALFLYRSWVLVILFGFFCGLYRAQWGDIVSLPEHNFFTTIRDYCDARLALFLDEPYKTLVSGIIFGGSSGFSSEWKQVFRSTGTMHIIAVSGANVAFVVNWIEWALRKTIAFPRTRFYVAAIAIGGYVLITGAPASVVRAGVMAFVMHVALLVGRRAYALHALAFAAAMMVVINPSIARDIGFQFSCLATLGLIMFESPGQKFAGMISETIAATLCILPLEIYYFRTASISALIANSFVLPFIPILMIAGGILVVFTLGPVLFATFVADIVQFFARIMLQILAFFSDIPGSSASIAISFSVVVVWYLILGAYFCLRCVRQIRVPI
jgi:competence protein ComEC